MESETEKSREGWHSYNTAHRSHGLGFAVHLVPEAFNIVHPIRNHYRLGSDLALDGRGEGRARIFLTTRICVCIARQAKTLVVDELDLEARDARVFRGRDAGVEVGDQLLAAIGLAR